jgi:glycosyltransferase involved in cell wall biosynthesis
MAAASEQCRAIHWIFMTKVNGTAIVVMAPLPPPVTGMTLLTQKVVEALRETGPTTVLNWSPGFSRKGLKFRLVRTARFFQSLARLVRRGRVHEQRLYTVSNSGAGLYFTQLLVYFARRLGYQVYLHHHSYAYIDRFDRRMARIDRWMQASGTHVVHCQKMIDDFRRRYDSRTQFATVLPSVVSIPVAAPRQSPHQPFRLGHLSNLTIDKGLEDVLQTFRKLHDMNRDVRLDLAGPVQPGEARELLQSAVAAYPSLVNHRGPIYGEEKSRFFAEIDAFLFPTRYRNESWGIVLHEALAAGVPVITYDRGCTRVVVGSHAGKVLGQDEDFVEVAADQIQRWMHHANEYSAASRAAIDQATFLDVEGRRTLEAFVEHMFSAPGRATNERAEMPLSSAAVTSSKD